MTSGYTHGEHQSPNPWQTHDRSCRLWIRDSFLEEMDEIVRRSAEKPAQIKKTIAFWLRMSWYFVLTFTVRHSKILMKKSASPVFFTQNFSRRTLQNSTSSPCFAKNYGIVTSEPVCAPAFFIVTVSETSLRVKKPVYVRRLIFWRVSSLVDRFLHSWTDCRIKPVFFNSEKVSIIIR